MDSGRRFCARRVGPPGLVAHVGCESEEGEVDGDVVTLRGGEEGLDIAKEAFVGFAGDGFDEFGVGHPDAGAHEGDAMAFHVGEVVFPDLGVARAGEIPSVGFRAEVVSSDGEERFSATGEEIAVDAECRARLQAGKIFNIEAVGVRLTRMSAGRPDGADGIEPGSQRFAESDGRVGLGSVERDGCGADDLIA